MLHEKFEVGGEYKRTDIAKIISVPIDEKYATGIEIIRLSATEPIAALLLVTLDKQTINADYNDYFYMGGKRFRWESQNRQDREDLDLIERGAVEVMLFCRLNQSIRPNVTRPHTYCGRLKWLMAFEAHPVKVNFTCLDYVANPQGSLAELYSWEPPHRDDRT